MQITLEEKKFCADKICLNYVETGTGKPLCFSHANGFPAGSYNPIFDAISNNFHISALNFCFQSRCASDCSMKKRPIKNWFQLSYELESFLDSVVKKPVVGVGHSLGGVVSIFTAVRRPDLFSRLILLDPTLLEPKLIRLITIMTILGKNKKFPLAERAMKRRNRWKNREEAETYFRTKPLFSNWNSEMVKAYVQYGLREDGDGVTLACPREMEAWVFKTYPLHAWRWARRLKTPVTIVRGVHSDVVTDASWKLFGKLKPESTMIQLKDAGHLFPMEKMSETARIIMENGLK